MRAGEHSDYGSLTLLSQPITDKGGLQVLVLNGSGISWLEYLLCLGQLLLTSRTHWSFGRLGVSEELCTELHFPEATKRPQEDAVFQCSSNQTVK